MHGQYQEAPWQFGHSSGAKDMHKSPAEGHGTFALLKSKGLCFVFVVFLGL